MTTFPPRISAARRNAEAPLDRTTKKEEGFKLEPRREQEKMGFEDRASARPALGQGGSRSGSGRDAT